MTDSGKYQSAYLLVLETFGCSLFCVRQSEQKLISEFSVFLICAMFLPLHNIAVWSAYKITLVFEHSVGRSLT